MVVNKTQAQVDELSLITRNQEELVDELSLITRQATGTQSHDVADRIIEQVAGVRHGAPHSGSLRGLEQQLHIL